MAGAIGDIAVLEQVALVHIGVEFALALHIVDSLRPAHELRDRALRPVAIEYFEAKPLRRQIALDRGQRVGRRSRQEAARTLVAVDSFTHEVVAAEIAHVDEEPIHHGGGIDGACAGCAASSSRSASTAWVEECIAAPLTRSRVCAQMALVPSTAGATISRIIALRRIP